MFYDIVHNTCTQGTSTTTIGVNGQPVSNANFSDTNPSAPGGNSNVHFQVSGNNVSAYAPNSGSGGAAPATCYADTQPGTTWDQKVQACLNQVYAQGGGTVDARGLTGAQTMAKSVTVGDNSHQTNLIMGAMTLTRAAGVQLFVSSYTNIQGQGQGTLIAGDAGVAAVLPAYGGPQWVKLSDFQINSNTGTVTKDVPALQIGGLVPNIPYGDPPAGATPGDIGSDPVIGSNFPGYIAQFAVYQKALTPAQIQNHWVVGSTGSNYEVTVSNDGPVSYFPLKETSGTSAADLIGGRTGTYTGTYTLASSNGIPGDTSCGGVCKTPLFSGGWVTLPSYTWIAGLQNWSVELWVNTNTASGPNKRMWGFSNNVAINFTAAAEWGENEGLQLQSTSGVPLPSGVAGQPQVQFSPGQWYHVVIVHTNGGVLFYVNGSLVPSGSDFAHGTFTNINAGGTDTGVLMNSQHGCICYNTFHNVTGSGFRVGVHTTNSSGYTFGVNQNQWYGGGGYGPIGLWDFGSSHFTYQGMDFENNQSSNNAIIYADPYYWAAGTGYQVGDTVRPSFGDGTAVLTVTGVRSGGSPTSLAVTQAGTGYGNYDNDATTTLTGSGTGLQVALVVSAYQLLLSNGGDHILDPYEESGGTDYICGSGYYIDMAYFSAAGAAYQPRRCGGATGQYGGPAANFLWGNGLAPTVIPVAPVNASGVNPGILFNSLTPFDSGSSAALFGMEGSSIPPILGLNYTGQPVSTYGFRGHAPLKIGTVYNTAGQSSTGVLNMSKIADPAAPTVTSTPAGGTTTYQYAIYCFGYSGVGGQSLQSPTGTTTTGPATLDGSDYNTVSWNCPDGYQGAYVLKNVSGTWQQLGGYQQQASTLNDTGLALSAYTAPTRNNTSDIYNPTGYFTAAGYVTQGLTPGTQTACMNGPNGSLTNVGCPANTQYVAYAPPFPTSPGSAGQWSTLNGTLFAYDSSISKWIEVPNSTTNWSFQAYDDFIGAANLVLTSHPDLQGHNWVQTFTGVWGGDTSLLLSGTGVAGTSMGSLYSSANSLSLYYNNFTPATPDYTVNLPCWIDPVNATGNGWCMAFARMQAPSPTNLQGYSCIYQQGYGVQLMKWTGGGAPTVLGTIYASVSSGFHTVSITTSGSNITCRIDNKLLTGTASATDSAFTTAGFTGLALNAASSGYALAGPFTVQ